MAHGKESTKKILEIIHHPQNIPTTRSVKRSDATMSHIGRICFRGDSRDCHQMFQEGFHLRAAITQRLANKIREIHLVHLIGSSTFNPEAFLMDMEELKRIAQTDASKSIIEELSQLTSLEYDPWILKTHALIDADGVVIMESMDELKAYKHDSESIISQPFHSHHMVATSKRFKSALMFPVYDESSELTKNKYTYIYAVYVEKGFDVHMHGIVSSLLDSKPRSLADVKEMIARVNPHLPEKMVDEKVMKIHGTHKILNITLDEAMHIYAEEIISDCIPKEHVVAALCVRRQVVVQPDGFSRGTYELGEEIHINPECTLPQKMIDQVKTFLMEEIRLNKIAIASKKNPYDATLPNPEDGYEIGHSGMHPE